MFNKYLKRISLLCFLLYTFTCLAKAPEYYLNSSREKFVAGGEVLYHYIVQEETAIFRNSREVYQCPDGLRILDFDVTEDNRRAGLVLYNEEGRWVVVYDLQDRKNLAVEKVTIYKPWKIAWADVDDDGVLEIALGVYKKTSLHRVMAKRLFIYSLYKNGLRPKWLGSKLSRPMEDFYFLKDSEKTVLSSVEEEKEGGFCLYAYTWEDFGFTGLPVPRCSLGTNKATVGYLRKGREFVKSLLIISPDNQVKGFTWNLKGVL